MPDPDAVLRRLTDRLAPLERDLNRACWAASTDASPGTSAAKQRAEEAWLRALADPGGDLAGTWWALVETLQGVHRPDGRAAPDWASKIHLAVAPVYYQSYLLGELLASQLDQAVREHAGGFVGRPTAGAFLAERVFAPGATRPWRDLVATATGRPLGPAAFLTGLAA
jgi:hypothetical protein